MSKGFVCPHCGHDEWTIGRTHTLWEMFHVEAVQPDGSYEENACSDFGETIETGAWEEITCAHCDSAAPANHPLWPEKEASHE